MALATEMMEDEDTVAMVTVVATDTVLVAAMDTVVMEMVANKINKAKQILIIIFSLPSYILFVE